MWCKTDLERKIKQLHYISANMSDALARNNKTFRHAMPNKETKLCGKWKSNSVWSVCRFTPRNVFDPQLPPHYQLLLLQFQLPHPLSPPLDWQTKHTLRNTTPKQSHLFPVNVASETLVCKGTINPFSMHFNGLSGENLLSIICA